MPPIINSFKDSRLVWDQGVPDHTVGKDGELLVLPMPELDYWSRSFYSPLLVKVDAETLIAEVDSSAEATLTTAFTLSPKLQFDQAGIMVKVSDRCWVKAGIEYTDGVPLLSCVVKNNGYSDWSTQTWELSP